jgi:DNA ligase-1
MFLKPMLATEREKPFDDERYLFEPLVQGQRLQLAMTGGKVKLLSRHGYDVTSQYPELHNVPLREPADVILDGKIAFVHPETGRTDVNVLQQRYRMKGSLRIREARASMPLRYFVFDILHYNGIDLREYPLQTRKRMLLALLENNDHYNGMVFARGSGITMFGQAKKLGLQGVIGKTLRGAYTEGISEDWIKVKDRP